VAFAVDLVHPPREIHQQLVEAPFEKRTIADALPLLAHVVHPEARPRMHWWVDVRELPLVGGQLAVRMLKLLEQQHPEKLLGEIRIDERERDGVEREIPRR